MSRPQWERGLSSNESHALHMGSPQATHLCDMPVMRVISARPDFSVALVFSIGRQQSMNRGANLSECTAGWCVQMDNGTAVQHVQPAADVKCVHAGAICACAARRPH